MLLLEDLPVIKFPTPGSLREHHPGVIAVGGNLLPENIIRAYKTGLFPWYNDEDPIIWWSPDPRMVLFPENLRRQKDVARLIRSGKYDFTINQGCEAIIRACAKIPRKGQDCTWINEEIIEAYTKLSAQNLVWCVGVWEGKNLVAGLYGVKLGSVFFGESMFSKISNGSKAALQILCDSFKEDIKMIDCQQETEHLAFMGASPIPREEFLDHLKKLIL